jgi:hypothetical protein
VVTPIDGAQILERARMGATHWLVLCEERRNPEPRWRVGLATPDGHLTEDALHTTLASAQADFSARRVLATDGKA